MTCLVCGFNREEWESDQDFKDVGFGMVECPICGSVERKELVAEDPERMP